ncbi:MAG: glycosyltransferase family 4 protein, partial [Thermoleophilia bacterium]|nr:glycosyltransferase family 4 protein [Thermoleophilia bacterium]
YQDSRFRVLRTKGTLPYIGPFPVTMPLSSLRAWWYQRKHPVDVIHSHNHMGFCHHLARKLWGGAGNSPFVLHLHITAAGREAKTIEAGKPIDPVTYYYEWRLHKWADRIGCEIADAVLCVSDLVRAEAIQFYAAPPEKLYVVPNGVNTRRFCPDGPNVRERYGMAAQDTVILYVGGLHERKNVRPLVEALALLPSSYKLLAVGAGSTGYVEALRASAKTL